VWAIDDLFNQGIFTTPREKISFAGLRNPDCSLFEQKFYVAFEPVNLVHNFKTENSQNIDIDGFNN
jgi:hypothetical protein